MLSLVDITDNAVEHSLSLSLIATGGDSECAEVYFIDA
jgi:hypothetical protein